MSARMDREAVFRRQESIFSRQGSIPVGSDPKWDSNGYLQPKAAEYDDAGNGFPVTADQIRMRNGLMRKPSRFDSGVADIDGSTTMMSTTSSRQYEEVDGLNQYEELPTPQTSHGTVDRQLSQVSQNSKMSPNSSVGEANQLVPDGMYSDSDETVALSSRASEKRKRYNPLYEALAESAPKLYDNFTKSRRLTTLEQKVACQWIIIIFLLLIVFAAFAVSVFLSIKFQDAIANRDAHWEDRLQSLENEFQRISFQNQLLTSILEESGVNVTSLEETTIVRSLQNSSAVIHTMTDSIAAVENQLVVTYQNVTAQLAALNFSTASQLEQVSKMQGPQGPPGNSNLKSCFYQNISSSAVATPNLPTTTNWKPDNFKDHVVMFAFCTVSGGTFHTLETQIYTPNEVIYRCQCSGRIEKEIYRICFLHMWLCPRET